MARTDHAREIRYALTDPRTLCERLGLLVDRKAWIKQASGVTVRCPEHGGLSLSVTRGPDGTVRAKCFGCDFTGDALELVARVRGLSTRRDFRAVLLEAAEVAGLRALAREIETGAERTEREPVKPPPRPREPERTYPSAREVAALLASCVPCTDDLEVSAWLDSRKLDAGAVGALGVAALPREASTPWWARYQGTPWTETGHRLIVPMLDAMGELRSVRAGRVVNGDTPKRLPPGGHKASELVMADELGAAMLRGTFAPDRVVVVEGEPDFLTWATRTKPTPTAVIGIVSGSWSDAFVERFPIGAEVYVRTDHDRAGEAYAQSVARRLAVRRGCFLRRTEAA